MGQDGETWAKVPPTAVSNHPQHKGKIMPKTINPTPFKTVTVALVVFTVLSTTNVVFGNPTWKPIDVLVRIAIPKVSGIGYDYVITVVPSDPCYHYSPGTLSTGHSWAGYTTSQGKELAHIRSGGLSYGFLRTIAGTIHTVTASDVDSFWEYVIYGSYTKISGASLSKNCHGHSTGVGYWLNDFQKLVDDDWTKYSSVGDLDSGAVYGGDGHSIRMDEVDITGTEYEITTSEKYSDSGVYSRKIDPTGGIGGSAVELDLKAVKWKVVNGAREWYSESVDPAIDHFYKKK